MSSLGFRTMCTTLASFVQSREHAKSVHNLGPPWSTHIDWTFLKPAPGSFPLCQPCTKKIVLPASTHPARFQRVFQRCHAKQRQVLDSHSGFQDAPSAKGLSSRTSFAVGPATEGFHRLTGSRKQKNRASPQFSSPAWDR
jgi:hypothetical protein